MVTMVEYWLLRLRAGTVPTHIPPWMQVSEDSPEKSPSPLIGRPRNSEKRKAHNSPSELAYPLNSPRQSSSYIYPNRVAAARRYLGKNLPPLSNAESGNTTEARNHPAALRPMTDQEFSFTQVERISVRPACTNSDSASARV